MMSEFFIQLTDLLGQRWAELLAIIGGSVSAGVIIRYLCKILCALIVAKISKKNNVPVNESVSQLQAQMKELKGVVDNFIEEAPKLLADATKTALKQQKQAKKKAYAKIVEGKEMVEEKIKEEIEEVKPIIEEAQKVVEEKVEEVKQELENVTKVVIKSE